MAFGNDIYIADNLGSSSKSEISHSYGKNEGITNQPYYLTGNTGSSTSFQPTEVEVYQVIKL